MSRKKKKARRKPTTTRPAAPRGSAFGPGVDRTMRLSQFAVWVDAQPDAPELLMSGADLAELVASALEGDHHGFAEIPGALGEVLTLEHALDDAADSDTLDPAAVAYIGSAVFGYATFVRESAWGAEIDDTYLLEVQELADATMFEAFDILEAMAEEDAYDDDGFDPSSFAVSLLDPRHETDVDDLPADDVVDRRAHLDACPLIAAVPALLAFISTSRPCTPSGAMVAADVAPLVEILGSASGGAVSVRELAAWWNAVGAAHLIEHDGVAVQAGDGAEAWESAEPLTALAVRQDVVAAFVGMSLDIEAERRDSPALAVAAAMRLAEHIALATRPDISPEKTADELLPGRGDGVSTDDRVSAMIRSRVGAALDGLAAVGLVEARAIADGVRYEVPAGLRPAVAAGVRRWDEAITALLHAR